MINYFLQQQPNLSPEVKHLIQSNLAQPRKYEPFHIDCEYTKKKICYCVNNPVLNVEMDPKVKERIWEKYESADDFYMGVNEEDKKKANEQVII